MGCRTNKVMKELNIGLDTVVKYLKSVPGLEPEKELKPNTKLSDAQYEALKTKFQSDRRIKEKADSISLLTSREHKSSIHITDGKGIDVKVVGKIDLDSINQETRPKKKSKEERKAERQAKSAEWLSKTETNPLNEDNNLEYNKNLVIEKGPQREQKITLSQLRFEDGRISFLKGNDTFVYKCSGFSYELNRYKNNSLMKDVTTTIILDGSNHTFRFADSNAFNMLELFKEKVDNEIFEQHIKEIEKEKIKPSSDITKIQKKRPRIKIHQLKREGQSVNDYKVNVSIMFQSLKFGDGSITILYNKRPYVYLHPKIIGYENIMEDVKRLTNFAIRNLRFKVEINVSNGTFEFLDFDILKYLTGLRKILPRRNTSITNLNKVSLPNESVLVSPPVPVYKTFSLEARNIHFHNGYFLILKKSNEEKDKSVVPYKVNDPDSHEILNLVHNYFEHRFEQMRIVVKYDGTKILEPSRLDIFQLKNYVRALRRNLEVKGEWWEEVQNARKRTFAQCYGESRDSVRSRYVKSKSEYLYNLSSLQNEKKLIRVYEINHGKEEDAFIFTIDMAGNRNAIVFENASNEASTTTWVFVAKNDNYEDCINMVFNYFTDYTIHSKRSSLRAKTVNPPEKFKAESYAFIDHDDLEQWLKKLNKVLENSPQPSEVKFAPGLNIPQSSETRTPSRNSIITRNLHNQLMLKLYEKLCDESGEENVGTEIRVGTKRIDAVVKGNGFYDIYEVKTASNSFDCITEALGQICQYAYLYCRDKIRKMVIVGIAEASSEVENYLAWFRKKHSMEVYYMRV